jgi:flavin reductase (DIM6/NTAB) family NADH-FMN oxidoreductase RutF
MRIEPEQLDPLAAYKLGVSVIVPRPIAWTGTRSVAGVDNLAPFSYFMGVSTHPPSVAISIARGRRGALKDSTQNILDTGVFTVSIVPMSHADAMNQCSAPWPADTSEFEACGLTAQLGERVAAPYPREAHVSMECRLVHTHDMGTTHLLVGEVLLYHIADSVVQIDDRGDAVVDAVALQAFGRLGGQDYAPVKDIFTLSRARVPDQK